MKELDWKLDGDCNQTDPDAFFPENGQNPNGAKKVCQGCPVRATCLAYALAHDERFGVWGGLTERERRALKRRGRGSGSAAA